MKNQRLIVIAAVGFFVMVMFLALGGSMFLTIDSGYKGVLFRPFSNGLDTENVYGQGFHLIAPWNDMYIYDVRILERTEEMDVLAKNGLNIHIDLSFRYKAIDEKIGHIHNDIGKAFADKVVIPEIRSATRKVIGEYLPEELYSTKRDAIQTEIYDQTEENLLPKNIHLDAVLIRSVTLPNTIKQAIEAKLEQEQQAQQYAFKIDKARQEAERQRIDAEGKAAANKILSASLTEKILMEKGIEATLQLANSPNAKVVVVGGDKSGGLPIILGGN